jgi:hypothetical protein
MTLTLKPNPVEKLETPVVVSESQGEQFERGSWSNDSPEAKMYSQSFHESSTKEKVKDISVASKKSKKTAVSKRLWSPDSRVQKQKISKITAKGKEDCQELDSEFAIYKKVRNTNEKHMKDLLEHNL